MRSTRTAKCCMVWSYISHCFINHFNENKSDIIFEFSTVYKHAYNFARVIEVCSNCKVFHGMWPCIYPITVEIISISYLHFQQFTWYTSNYNIMCFLHLISLLFSLYRCSRLQSYSIKVALRMIKLMSSHTYLKSLKSKVVINSIFWRISQVQKF